MSSRFLAATCFATLLSCAAAATAATEPGQLDATDSKFIQTAAADGMAEIQLGQMALSKSSNASIKSLAQKIVDDHGKANDQLKTLATSKQITFPTAADADAQKESKKLDALSGASFDKAWSKDMVDGHKKAVKLFTAESKNAKDNDVRNFAQSTLPVLQSHLDMATQVASVPDARDKAMDQAMKSMSDTDSTSAAAPAATTPAATPISTAAPSAPTAATAKPATPTPAAKTH